jgi:hypothetical protein
MDYQFETLGPEHFQHFCQALLVRNHPNLQCFPVAQPDGGRDAIEYLLESDQASFLVFQVKYVRNPQSITEPHKWLLDIISDEAPKVQKLIPKGATQYILMTNVSGTAHLDAGSIDKAHQLLHEALKVPSQCWWRDDLARRLDTFPALKWAYPTLLSGGELLRLLLESGLREAAERRITAIRAFVRDQYRRDEDVRFKQVELQNKLLDLFIDVPAVLRSGPRKRVQDLEWRIRHTVRSEDMREFPHHEEAAAGAATILLIGDFQQRLPKTVLEGAPGQGKSTVVQYVCQIHRRRILGESVDLPEIPTNHRSNPIRLPFKIDLRDFALWLSKKNPFAADDSQPVPSDWHKSLESFLAAQIHFHSGGSVFSVDDLQAIAKISAILLVFDGLDEVADIARRKEVVDEINKAVNRLTDIAASLQSVVTTRPTAFSNAPGFLETEFVHLELTSISPTLINAYANRWIRARNLQGREAGDVRKILREKLNGLARCWDV